MCTCLCWAMLPHIDNSDNGNGVMVMRKTVFETPKKKRTGKSSHHVEQPKNTLARKYAGF